MTEDNFDYPPDDAPDAPELDAPESGVSDTAAAARPEPKGSAPMFSKEQIGELARGIGESFAGSLKAQATPDAPAAQVPIGPNPAELQIQIDAWMSKSTRL